MLASLCRQDCHLDAPSAQKRYIEAESIRYVTRRLSSAALPGLLTHTELSKQHCSPS